MDYPTDLTSGFFQLTLNYRSIFLKQTAPQANAVFYWDGAAWHSTGFGGFLISTAETLVSNSTGSGSTGSATVIGNLVDQIQTPLGPLLDGIWSSLGTGPADQVQTAILKAQSNAYDINVTFPSSGTTVHAGTAPDGQGTTMAGLSYALPGVRATFKTTTSGPFGSSEDPSITLTFDGEVQIGIPVPGVPPYTLAPQVNFLCHNASVSGNIWADVSAVTNEIAGAITGGILEGLQGALVGGVVAFLPGEIQSLQNPGGGPVGTVDSTDLPYSVSQLTGPFQTLGALFNTLATMGFISLACTIDVDPSGNNPSTLDLTLSHPVAKTPVAQAIAGPNKSLVRAGIAGSTGAVPPGGSLLVTGADFAPGSATPTLGIQWDDTTMGLNIGPLDATGKPTGALTITVGNTTQCDIQYGVTTAAGTPPTSLKTVTITKAPGQAISNTYVAPPSLDLKAGAVYGFQVREHDFSDTATDYSAWVYVQALVTDQAALKLLGGRSLSTHPGVPESVPLGDATVNAKGGFSTTVTVPTSVALGNYTLEATTSNATASMPLAVVAPGQAMIQMIDPHTGTVVRPSVVGGESVTVRGSGFQAGVITLYVDSSSGQKLGTASIAIRIDGPGIGAGALMAGAVGSATPQTKTVESDGSSFTTSFAWPLGVNGPHSIVALESAVGGTSIEASLAVTAQAPAS